MECPSIYEMLPNIDFDWKKKPQIQVWRKQSKDGETSVELESYGPDECVTLFEEALKSNEVLLTSFCRKKKIAKLEQFGLGLMFLSLLLACE